MRFSMNFSNISMIFLKLIINYFKVNASRMKSNNWITLIWPFGYVYDGAFRVDRDRQFRTKGSSTALRVKRVLHIAIE